MSRLRLMCNNLWKCDKNAPAWEEKGENCSASVRAEGFYTVYEDTAPDLIGCQEASALMVDALMCKFSSKGIPYSLLWGRDTPIIYRSDKLELLDSAFSLYPEECPGFEGCFNNSMSKSWNIGVFRIKENQKVFAFLTTHLWWKSSNPESTIYQEGSDEARVHQLKIAISQLAKYQKKYECPAILVGDLNAGYTSPAVQYVLGEEFVHAHDVAVEYADETRGYHTCTTKGYGPYRDEPFRSSMDHIFVKGVEENAVRRFDRFAPDYYLPLSDHLPVFIDIEF